MVSSATPIGQSTATAENQKILESHQTTPSVTPTGLFKVISIIMFQHTTMILIWNKPHYYPKRKIKQSVPLQNDKKKKKTETKWQKEKSSEKKGNIVIRAVEVEPRPSLRGTNIRGRRQNTFLLIWVEITSGVSRPRGGRHKELRGGDAGGRRWDKEQDSQKKMFLRVFRCIRVPHNSGRRENARGERLRESQRRRTNTWVYF